MGPAQPGEEPQKQLGGGGGHAQEGAQRGLTTLSGRLRVTHGLGRQLKWGQVQG